ncbi:PP2C family serine/threonine-protein phosphatase [Actinoplanes sp. NPDC049548]|uniref:PP2C family protein-serine/threonine phosphatase n=1 Tax=Actinoplanes sp. NPDC049548 TaxID=3155152 RepID=UPI00341561AC
MTRAAGMRLSMAGGTVVGNRYPANFDVLHIDAVHPLVVVADGMGDGRGSAVAGRTAVDTFVGKVVPEPDGLRAAVAEVQARVRAAGAGLGELTGCTLTAFVAGERSPGAWLVQLGDSRVYRLRDDLLELLTTDHTVAWLGAVHGWWPAGSAEAHAARYRLTRYAGHPGAPEPDVLSVTVRPGDVYLLCTDGLTDQVGYERLAGVLSGGGDPARAVETLLTDSLAAGGEDNTTVAVIRAETGGGDD